MRYACSMVSFVDGGLPFGSLVLPLPVFGICLLRSLSVLSAGFSPCFRSRSTASDMIDVVTVGWKFGMRPVGMKRPLALFIAFLKVYPACSTVIVSPASARYLSQASA